MRRIRWLFDYLEDISLSKPYESIRGRTCSKEESDEREDHFVAEVLIEEKHPQHYANGNQTKDRHCVLDELENSSKLLDVSRKLIDQLTREDVGPKAVLALTERYL